MVQIVKCRERIHLYNRRDDWISERILYLCFWLTLSFGYYLQFSALPNPNWNVYYTGVVVAFAIIWVPIPDNAT